MEPNDSLENEKGAQTAVVTPNRRRRLMDRLAAARAELLWQVLDADARTLSESPVFQEHDWTAKDLLAHIAAWDGWEHRTMASMLAGEQPDFTAVEDIDAFNRAVVAEWRDQPLNEVLAELQAARATWEAWLEKVPEEPFFRSRWFQDWDWTFPNCLEVQWQHDAEHAEQIAAWRREKALEGSSGPRTVLSAALKASCRELLTAAALVPSEERTSRRVCGLWTLKDVIGHLADWQWVGVEGLRDMAVGHSPKCEHISNIESWNRAHAAARQDEAWEEVWADLNLAREGLASVLERMTQEALTRSYHFPWGPEGTAHEWIRVFISHDRGHAEDLRAAMADRAERSGPA